ncbi:MAG: 4Fe-4S binding protein, partial [Promethearchaeota archaeon]
MSKENKLWYKIARKIIKSGGVPFPISASLIEIVRILFTEEQAKIVLSFKKRSMSLDQLVLKSKLDKQTVLKLVEEMVRNGVMVATPSRSTGIMVYHLLGPVPGIFEMQFMKGETGNKQKILAELFESFFKDIGDGYQMNYDNNMELFKQIPPLYRIIPVKEELDAPEELILPLEIASKIVEKFDTIAVSNCYCRHHRELLNDPCKISAPKKNCLFFGRVAQFYINYNFAEEISKQEAVKLLKEAKDFGLVHRTFHSYQDPKNDEFALCNCCKCCCEVFYNLYKGNIPMKALTSFIASVTEELCVGCEICIEKCPMEAIGLLDNFVEINEKRCIGC